MITPLFYNIRFLCTENRMLYCRGARLSAAALDLALNSTGFNAHMKANRLRDITWPLHNNTTFECSRALSGYTGSRDSACSLGGKLERDMITAKCWDSSRFIITHREKLTRVISYASDLSKSHQQSIYDRSYCIIRSPLFRAGECQSRQHRKLDALQSILFTSGAKVCTPRYPTITTVQMRASSTATAPQKRETGAREDTDNKGQQEESTSETSSSSSSSSSFSSSSSSKSPDELEPEQLKPNKTQQLKKVFKEYGAVGVSFHVCMSLMSLGMFYLAVSSGIDMAAILCKLGFSETVVQSKMAAGTSTFVLAYAVHKLFAPLRISITLVAVPLIVRYLRKTGLFRPPATPTP